MSRVISSRGFNRQAVRRAIRQAKATIKTYRKVPDTGLILFCGEGKSYALVPPTRLQRNFYRCDSRFHTELVQDLFVTHQAHHYLVVTSKQAYLAKAQGSERHILFNMNTNLPTDTRRGGQSTNRLARIRKEKRHVYQTKIVAACEHFLRGPSTLIVAGNTQLPREILERLRQSTRLSHVTLLGYHKISEVLSLNQIIDQSLGLIQDKKIQTEAKIISELRDLIRQDPDLLVFGRTEVQEAQYQLRYLVLQDSVQDLDLDIECRRLKYSTFLESYGGMIGVRYYKLS